MTGKTLLTDKQYDILKWLITIVLPAIGTALLGLGQIFDWIWASTAVQVMVIIETLLGTVFAISSATYTAKIPSDETEDDLK